MESLDAINECPPEMGEGGMPPMGSLPAPMDKGNPVTMNVSLNASGKEHVEDLINMMKNAGMNDAKEVSADMMPMRMDMERLRDIVDEPKEDVEVEEGGMKDQLIQAMEKIAADGDLLHKAMRGAMGPDVQSYLQDMYDDVAVDNGLHPDDDHDEIEEKMLDQIEADYGMQEWANSPEGVEGDEDYRDQDYMTNMMGDDLHKKKKAYKAAQDGDNAMAVESIKEQLLKALAEKKAKPDFLDMDKDGDKKEPMKKAIKDKESKKKNESVEGVCEDCGNPSWKTLPEEKQKGVDGKVCWKGYKRMGTKKKGGKTVDNCVKM